MPKRVRVRGDYFHGVIPDGAIYVGRYAPGLPASPYRNPHHVGKSVNGYPAARNAAHAVKLFEAYAEEQGPDYAARVVEDLAGRDLACWCPLPGASQADTCHAVTLLRIANQERP